MSSRMTVLAWLAILPLVFASCGAGAPGPAPIPPPLPTRTPRPTFTPTVPVPTATLLVPTETPVVTATVALSMPTTLPPTAVVTPTAQAQATLTANDLTNVRSGPGTNYDKIGQLTQGQQAAITGKTAAGDWWQFNFNGQTGWVSAAMVTASDAASSVPVAQTIPPSPVPVAQPVVQQPAPQPTQPPAPAPTAAPSYPFVADHSEAPPQVNPTYSNGLEVRGWIGCSTSANTCVAATLKVSGPGGSKTISCGAGVIAWDPPGSYVAFHVYNGLPECKLDITPFVPGTYTAVLVNSGGNPQSDALTFDAEGNTRSWFLAFRPR